MDGVQGIGEVPIIPPLAAISNTIHDAAGIRFLDRPMSHPKVLKALDETAPTEAAEQATAGEIGGLRGPDQLSLRPLGM